MSTCDYTAVCTPGLGKDCARVAGKPNAGCLCPCHPDGLGLGDLGKPDDWKPDPIHAEALKLLEDLGARHRLEACDPGGECYFPRCLADGCEAVDSDACLIDVALTDAPDAPDAPGFGGRR